MDNRIRPIGPLESAATCAGVATLAGAAVFGLLFALGGWTFLQAIFGGFVVFVVLLLVLLFTVGKAIPSEQPETQAEAPVSEAPGASVDLSQLRPRDVNAASPHREAIETSAISDVTSGPRFAGADERPATVGLVGSSEAPAQDAAPEAPPEPAPAPQPEPVAKSVPTASDPAASAEPEAVAPPVAEAQEESKPTTLQAPRDGAADDLKKIKGIGPKLEQLCNSLGFWHFDQIANWTPAEVAWVDQNLEGFKGRVTRDQWVDQAKTLADGGDTAFSKKVDKGGVY